MSGLYDAVSDRDYLESVGVYDERVCEHGVYWNRPCDDCDAEGALEESELLLPNVADLGVFPFVEPCAHLIGHPERDRYVRGIRALCDGCAEAWDRGDLTVQDLADERSAEADDKARAF